MRLLGATLLLLLASSARAQDRRVLVIGIDGVRVDILASANTPNLDALIAAGAFTDSALTGLRTLSGPGWSSMLTGVVAEKHGVLTNDFSTNRYDDYPDFLTRLERHDRSWHTLAIACWAPLMSEADGGPLISPLVDTRILFNGDSIGFTAADDSVAAAAEAVLTRDDVQAAFVYFGNVDVVGHETSSLSPEYRAAVEATDVHVGRVMAALRSRPSFESENWLVLISTDHGRRDDGGHGTPTRKERTIFYLAWGPTALRGRIEGEVRIEDVAATALAYLGVRAELDGRPRGISPR